MELKWPTWSKQVSPEATFRCGFAVRRGESFRLCRNKDKRALIPSRTGGAAKLHTNPAFPAAAKVAQGSFRVCRARVPAGGTTDPHLARTICPLPTMQPWAILGTRQRSQNPG